ncbi:phage baseplate assembly protein V [Vibrio campbellii]|uniref:phage baseplate assembly protein V n=1 Tax=Vibrio campbellii TaxID=680 RepID=UPI00210B239F|nr:phage baseplate assembly protein V [Vibrio campbellii]UTZ44795.1 phage baseplate assembly protein V [Vibrio campbellii]UTZ44835.1 phage baseplate assembly protein V [Vibrio campbellii]
MNLTKAVLELTRRVNGLERQLRNLIRLGRVKSVSGAKAVIDYAPNSDEDYLSPPIQWIAFEAGEVLKWRAPSLGEQVVVLNLSGGIDEAQAIALPAAYCSDFSPDNTDPRKTILSILDVFKVTSDFDGNYLVEADSSVKFITPAFFVEASDVISMQTSEYNRTASTANIKGTHTQTGDVKIKGALDVSMQVKTPTLVSYTPGAFSLNAGGATLVSVSVNGLKLENHRHMVNKEGQPTDPPME